MSPAAALALRRFKDEHSVTPAATAALRELAGVKPDAVSIGIGDGGNEVGLGKVRRGALRSAEERGRGGADGR